MLIDEGVGDVQQRVLFRSYLVKQVTTAGTLRLQHKLLYIANALVDQHIGLEETDDGIWSIYFNTVLRATVDERDYIIRG